jgi:hypothetical protein
LEEHAASIFRVIEEASMKQVASRARDFYSKYGGDVFL